ncbi:hypothetical protein F5B22DRAFT_415567 [Xylaria bambusicola]|uniref:uncharacterized protein n=1 Tax=Xylaria bambusicola TaxID=326684 RepID=UPI0020085507|nr:uncharacterized protein F5B22DRAFT_415567 [Xylaria bambusicola]KAI0523762.1 hypothetical protein F5B22DRAFT_415567 [Xylaria bambusicola]
METLRKLADIPEDRFKKPPSYFSQDWITHVHARSFGSRRAPEFQQVDSTSTELLGKIAELERRPLGDGAPGIDPQSEDATASLMLVTLNRDRDEKIILSKSTFMEIYQRFGIDQRFLQHISTNRYGLHYDWNGQVLSYYVGTALYILMWSFDRRTRATRAILLSRDFISTGELGSLRQLLQLEIRRMHSPFLLAWVSLVHLSNWMDSSTYYLLTTIRQLEELTGYGPYGMHTTKSEIPIDQLTQASKNVGYVQVNLANQLRHVTIGQAIASHISSRKPKLADYAIEPFIGDCEREIDEFHMTTNTLKRSLNDSAAYVYYLQERVKSQNTVVYALMQQADAKINIGLAKASKELAEAAKKDSSSMKSIAIMTMLFLPGTYFAALWAVPSLKWGQADVIQSDFWVYWAFTLPSTLLIFIVWFGLHKWRFSRSLRPPPMQQLAGYEALAGQSAESYHGLTAAAAPAPSTQYTTMPPSNFSAPPLPPSFPPDIPLKPADAYSAPAMPPPDTYNARPPSYGLPPRQPDAHMYSAPPFMIPEEPYSGVP